MATLASSDWLGLVVMAVVAKLGRGPGGQREKTEGDELKQERKLKISLPEVGGRKTYRSHIDVQCAEGKN